MTRDLRRLAEDAFDVAIVGGGIHGAAAAWEAASRGLSVALVEKGDFAGATSSNSLKIIHGGLRYLQTADFRRMRESIRERRALTTIAPHLVRPMRFVVPAGAGLRGRAALRLALAATDAIGFDRHPDGLPSHRLPRGRLLSRDELLRAAPGLGAAAAERGGAEFWDCQVHDSERLVIEFLRAAAESGAAIANYVEVTGVSMDDGRSSGVSVRDTLTGDAFQIRARSVVNAAGPWGSGIVALARQALSGARPGPAPRDAPDTDEALCRGWNLVLPAAWEGDAAVGIPSAPGGADASVRDNRPGRFLFLAPWRGRSILGTAYSRWTGSPDDLRLDESDVNALLDELARSVPDLRWKASDVRFVHAGILPADASADGSIAVGSQAAVVDHAGEGLPGLLTIRSVKYTTARALAERAVDRLAARIGRPVRASETAQTPLPGGRGYAASNAPPQALDASAAPLAEDVLRAVRNEWAVTLPDVVLRRTGLGTAGHPGRPALEAVARAMAAELGWDAARTAREIAATETAFRAAR